MGRTVSLDWIHISRMYVFSTVCCHTEGVNCTELFQKYKYFKRIRVVSTEVSMLFLYSVVLWLVRIQGNSHNIWMRLGSFDEIMEYKTVKYFGNKY